MTTRPKRRWFQFSLRTLLVVMTVAAVLAGRITYLRQRADLHQAEANRLQKHRDFLFSVSFDVPPAEWERPDLMEGRHPGLAREYERASWRPWIVVRESASLHPGP
ncbi:MAG: hypothetical protein IAF94_27185 [Pirellulaceae bacterium]|nr:hypothetical protein [Pirellulaceae bacterium]